MTVASTNAGRTPSAFAADDDRWQAVVSRDPAADGAFCYAVRTTGVYCRPVCTARLARRANVQFYATTEEAERAGFRPCKRCRPNEATFAMRQAALVEQACRAIEVADETPNLDSLAKSAGLSSHHFHRVFKAHTGVTPKGYADAQRFLRIQDGLTRSETVTEAIYDAGFNSNSRFYESTVEVLGMTPTEYRTGAHGISIRFAVGQCCLGAILVAASSKGVCAILLGDDPDNLVRNVQDRFPMAELIGGDTAFEQLVAKVVAFAASPDLGLNLPLDIRGTAFQRRVWEALRGIPSGSTASYAEIAQRIGQPGAVRAVAQACAANPLAVAIPCHRVIRSDGSLSGYRWGVERKAELLKREREAL